MRIFFLNIGDALFNDRLISGSTVGGDVNTLETPTIKKPYHKRFSWSTNLIYFSQYLEFFSF